MNTYARVVFALGNGAAALIFWSLAVVVARRILESRLLRVWFAVCIVGGLYNALLVLVGQAGGPESGLVFGRLSISAAALGMAILLLFAVTYHRPARWGRIIAPLGLGWLALLLILFWSSRLVVAGVTESEFSRWAPVAGPWMPLYLAYLSYTWFASLGLFIHAYRRGVGLRRQQLIYVFFAFGFGFVGAIGSLLPALLERQTLAAILPGLLFPLFPLLITYAVVRHRLWDIRTVMHRTAAWVTLSLLLVLPLFGLLWLLRRYTPQLTPLDEAVLLTALFGAAYLALRPVKGRLDQLFQRRAADRQRVLDEFARAMTALAGTGQVVGRVLGTLGGVLYPVEAAALVSSGENGSWRRFDWPGEQAPVGAELDTNDPFVAHLVQRGAVVLSGDLGADPDLLPVRPAAEAFFDRQRSQLVLPLVQAGQLLGLVCLGGNQNLKPYNRDDVEFVERLGAEAAIALANALLFERVDRQRQDLVAMAASLEQRVQERTAELAEVNRALSAANEALRDLDRMKSRFFANISHELRTPLTLVLVPVDSLLEGEQGELAPELREQLLGVQRSALLLLKLIDDLLDLSRLEECALRLVPGEVDLGGLLRRLIDFARPLALRKRVALDLEAAEPVRIEADEPKLERVFVNLLSNALKFTGPGGRVVLRLRREGTRVRVDVSDTGAGIAPEDRPLVFDRFCQGAKAESAQTGGSGIGLALVKELVELHGGSVTLESELGIGSRFTVELPGSLAGVPPARIDRRVLQLPVPVERRAAEGSLPEWRDDIQARPEYRFMGLERATERRLVERRDPGTPKVARLLLVDDNADVLRYLVQLMEDRYEVWPVTDGARALELLERERHDLVLADVMMPGMNGLELCRRIKTDGKLQHTPVVLVTARGGVEHRIEGHNVGADAYLAKPFRTSELNAVVARLLAARSRWSESAARRRAASLATLMEGLAHELRNACQQAQGAQGAIVALGGRLAGGADASTEIGPQIATMVSIARQAMARIDTVVRSLQQLVSQGGPEAWREIDFDRLVERAVGLLGIPHRQITVGLALQSGARLRGPEEELRQAVINLVENSIQAVAAGGAVTVRTEAVDGRLRLTVRDDGCGISPDNLERVFDPFFTTKEPGQGSGLGLALVKRTVDDLGGRVEMHSRSGEGTEVVIELPTVVRADGGGLENPAP